MLAHIAVVCLAGLAAIWGLYPLVMALLARRRTGISPAAASAEPAVSVVIASRDDDPAIRARVADCLASRYPRDRLEIVVALDRGGAALETRNLEFPGERVRVVAGDEPPGKSATLNAGVRAAAGDVLVFTDTHQRFDPDAIRQLTAALAAPRVGAVSGALDLPPARGSLVERYWVVERRLRRDEAAVHSSVGVTGAIWGLRRSLWKPLPPGLILDDVYTPMRLVLEGYRVAFADSARASETRLAAPRQEYRRKVRTLTGVVQLCAWLPAVLLPWRNPIWAQFLFHKLLRLATPYLVLGIGLWLAAVTLPWLAGHLPEALAAAAAAVAAGALARVNVLRVARNAVVSGLLMQAAVVVATVNGVRGRWDVWSK